MAAQVQELDPATLVVPAGHAVQLSELPVPVEKYADGHAHEAAPAALVATALRVVQAVQALAPASEYEPAAQMVQPPATVPKKPAAQRLHCAEEVAPRDAVVVPAGQELQAPLASKVPTGQPATPHAHKLSTRSVPPAAAPEVLGA